jgi:hypothetical protein
MMLRRAGVIAAGLAMATSFGLAGAGAASAVEPALHIHNGATWTIEVSVGSCQHDVFTSNGHFTSPDTQFGGDRGRWTGGGPTITMEWTAGNDAGLTFDHPGEVQGPVRRYRRGLRGSARQGIGAGLLTFQRSSC